ncbi:MAG: hypothetical protein JWL81_3273 [Verrucomicrobiales bacterium]|nr:hypothetical protein [Verrucomicrobiales bacterium]
MPDEPQSPPSSNPDPATSSSAVSPAPAPSGKPGNGCIMIAVVAGWLLILGVWMIWNLTRQVKEIRTFADPVAQAIAPQAPTGEEKAALQARLKAFADAIDAKQKAALELTVADLNHLLASQEPVSRLQDIAKVEEITDSIRVKVALALNGIPFSGERLYLNGFILARPELQKDIGLMLLTRDLEVPGKTLTPGFKKTYLDANHLDGLALDEVRKNDKVKTWLSKITAIRCEAGRVIAEYIPPATPAPAAPAPAVP